MVGCQQFFTLLCIRRAMSTSKRFKSPCYCILSDHIFSITLKSIVLLAFNTQFLYLQSFCAAFGIFSVNCATLLLNDSGAKNLIRTSLYKTFSFALVHIPPITGKIRFLKSYHLHGCLNKSTFFQYSKTYNVSQSRAVRHHFFTDDFLD